MNDELLLLKAFQFSLKDLAKYWFFYLPSRSITLWTQLKKEFLEKFCTPSMSTNLKKQISSVEQKDNESFYDYWERFKRLVAACPYHGYDDHSLIMYFYEGLSYDDRKMVNSSCGGNIATKTVEQAKAIFKELAEGTRVKGKSTSTRRLHAVDTHSSDLEQKVDGLTEIIKSLVANNSNSPTILKRVCGICTSPLHPTDACPTLQEDDVEQVNAIGFQNQNYPRSFEPYST